MVDKPGRTPRWVGVTLTAAAVYNLVWGVWAVVWPNALFDWAGMERPNYPHSGRAPGRYHCSRSLVRPHPDRNNAGFPRN